MHVLIAGLLQVEVNVLDSHAFIGKTSGIRTVFKDNGKVVVQQPDGDGWCMTEFCIDDHMWDIADQPVLACMAKHDTLFLAFALTLPCSFEGCIWNAKQHAEQHAQAGMLLDYECIPYEQNLRRMTVQHICDHWGEFAALVAAEHGPAITSASTYRQLMLHKYSNTSPLVEGLALCDIYNCSVDVYDCDSNAAFTLFPCKLAASPPSEVALLRIDKCHHVLLPSTATNVMLPGLMCVPPDIIAAYGDRMIYTRDVAMGVSCCSMLEDTDVLPPVCLAMPLRSLQGVDLAAAPEPWSDDSVSMFSFAPGRFYGWDVSRVQSWYDDIAAFPAFDSTNSGSGSGSGSFTGTDADGGSSDADTTKQLTNTPVLTIPCPSGGHAIARFMAAGCFMADVLCWQCLGLLCSGYQRAPGLQGLKVCTCTKL